MQRLRDLAALVGRLGIGIIFVAHGWQKFNEWGIAGTASTFEKMGIPMPTLSAWFAAVVELAGGALLIVGFALPIVGILLAVNMAGALFLVHLSNGLLGQGGFELVLALGIAALALGFNGGSLSLDRALFARKSSGATVGASA